MYAAIALAALFIYSCGNSETKPADSNVASADNKPAAAPADDGGVHLSLARSVSWPEAGGRPSMGMRRAGGLIARVLCIEADGSQRCFSLLVTRNTSVCKIWS